MTNHDPNSELIRLAGLLSTRPISEDSYKLDELLTGIESERKRLGQGRFLVLLIQKDFDIDGLTDYVFPLESFDSKSEAVRYIKTSAKSLYENQITGPGRYGSAWQLESRGEIPYMTRPQSGYWAHRLRSLYDETYKLRGGTYDTLYNCFRVVGPFRSEVVSDELISFVNQRAELWAHFVDAGEAAEKGIEPRQPH